MNYFGKHVLTGSGTGKIKIKPVLMRKGNTKLALYGLGYIRDARLHQMFSLKGNVEWARPEDKPGFSSKSWFNTMLIHQNRVHHSPKNAISERYLPSWLDLVVWGHEHECLVEPTEYGDFMVSQLGSSVVTSLIEGEAKQKQVIGGQGGFGRAGWSPHVAHDSGAAGDVPAVQVQADRAD